MGFKALLVLVMLMATILVMSAEVPTKDSDEKFDQEGMSNPTNVVDESKIGHGGGGGGFGGRGGGFGGGGGRGGYGGWRGGYGGGWRGGYGGWRGGYCPYGCCYWGYYGDCLRCCYYPGDRAEANIEAKPNN